MIAISSAAPISGSPADQADEVSDAHIRAMLLYQPRDVIASLPASFAADQDYVGQGEVSKRFRFLRLG